jgi:hypothetical protein
MVIMMNETIAYIVDKANKEISEFQEKLKDIESRLAFRTPKYFIFKEDEEGPIQ